MIIGLGSSIRRYGEQSGTLVSSCVWDELIDGRMSVASVVDQILGQIRSVGGRHGWADGIGLLAEIALDSALFGCDVWIDQAPDTDTEFAQFAAAFPALDSGPRNREGLWLVRDRGTGRPFVCVRGLDASAFTVSGAKPVAVADAMF